MVALMKVVTMVVLMVASFGITATTGVPTQQCQDKYNQDCTSTGQGSQQVGKMNCCSTITMMLFSMDPTCICDIFAAQGLSTKASISFLKATCNITYNGQFPCGGSSGNGTTSPTSPSAPAPSTSRGGGVNPVASPKGALVPPSVSPSAGSVGSLPAPPSQSPTSALPPRPSASSPSAAGSVESPPAPPSEGPNSAPPPSEGPNSAAPPSKGQTSGQSPNNDFPPEAESPLPERNPRAAFPPSGEGWRPKTFLDSFGLTAMYLFCVFVVA